MDDLRKKYDIEIHFVNDGIVIAKDTYGTQIQNWDMHVFMAKQKINRLKEDAFNTIQTKLNNGELPGLAPFGYINYTKEDNKKWVKPHPVKSLTLRKIFDWYASGNFSYRGVSAKVKEEFSIYLPQNSIQQIITNRFYEGIIEHSGRTVPHHYDLVVPEDIYQKAQEVRVSRAGDNKRRRMAGKNKKHDYRGILTCHECGAAMTPDPKKKKLKNGKVNIHKYYHCTNHFKVHDIVVSVSQDNIDDQFVEVFERMKIPRDKLEMIAGKLEGTHAQNQDFYNKQYTHLSTELKKVEAGLKKGYKDYARGSITEERYLDFEQSSNEDKKTIEKQIKKLERLQRDYYLTTAHLVRLATRIADIFRGSIMEEKRAILNFVFSNLTVEGKKVRYIVKYPFSEVLKYAPCAAWLPLIDTLRNRATELEITMTDLKITAPQLGFEPNYLPELTLSCNASY